MGVKRLKIKDELRYRPKSSDREYCSMCEHFVRDMQIKGIGGADLGEQHRCHKIGLNAGRGYRIRVDYKCDAFTYGRHLA